MDDQHGLARCTRPLVWVSLQATVLKLSATTKRKFLGHQFQLLQHQHGVNKIRVDGEAGLILTDLFAVETVEHRNDATVPRESVDSLWVESISQTLLTRKREIPRAQIRLG
jgi:hypothetical protein